MFSCFLSFFVSVQVSDACVNVLSIVVFFSLNFSFFDMFLLLNNFCSIKYVLLALFMPSCKSIWLLLSSLSITPKYLKFSTLSNMIFFYYVLFYFSLKCFSFPLSYTLSFLGSGSSHYKIILKWPFYGKTSGHHFLGLLGYVTNELALHWCTNQQWQVLWNTNKIGAESLINARENGHAK